MKVAVIPARGGSKRIPRKNIRPFCGKPMIVWSIEAALSSDCFNHVIVSTDDGEIADIARSHGADVPFMRPAELADDYAGTIPVIRHAIQWWADHAQPPELACCIYATAPFIAPADIARGLGVLQDTGCDYAFSVTGYASPIQRALRITDGGRAVMFDPKHFDTRSQDLEPAYHDGAQFYWGRATAWLAGKPIFGPDSAPVLLPQHHVQDIDTEEDWVRAEWMYRSMQLRIKAAKR